jgi:peptidoglycan/xylan/chitin deacetylase (PgdA/CDA1 family)
VSVPVSVSVANPAPPPPPPSGSELLQNPGLETPGVVATVPAAWSASSWGSITATFTAPTGGAHGGNRFARVEVTSRSSGDAKWMPAPQPVVPGRSYRLTDWYRSNRTSQVLAVFETSGSTIYQWLGDPVAAAAWTKYSATVVAPPGATTMTIYHLISGVGWLETDDYSLTVDQPQPFSRALVSLTFDDGWTSHATEALPRLQQAGMRGTFYITTGFLDTPAYLTTAQLTGLHAAGQDLGAHTIDHPHLTQLASAQVDAQLQVPRATLQSLYGVPASSFASPYGEYDAATLQKIRGVYGSHRTVNSGFNTKLDTDVYQLRVQNITSSTTSADVAAWVAAAQAQGSWLILVFHDLTPTPSTWDSTPASFSAYLDTIRSSGIAVVTVAEALAEITPQMAS